MSDQDSPLYRIDGDVGRDTVRCVDTNTGACLLELRTWQAKMLGEALVDMARRVETSKPLSTVLPLLFLSPEGGGVK